MLLVIHTSIKEKLVYFHKIHKIPNIIFHGQSGCGKKTIVFDYSLRTPKSMKSMRNL